MIISAKTKKTKKLVMFDNTKLEYLSNNLRKYTSNNSKYIQ